VNADEIIALIVLRCLVRQNVPSHQVPNGEVLGAQRDDWESKRVFVPHCSTSFSRPAKLAVEPSFDRSTDYGTFR
jgi:hypothetical protein